MTIVEIILFIFLLGGQNAAHTLVSRARQSTSLRYHTGAAILSNGFFVFGLSMIIANYNSIGMKILYIVATTLGSVLSHKLAMRMEKGKRLNHTRMVSQEEMRAEIVRLETLINLK